MNKINEKIRGLNYATENVLAYNGETISEFVPKEGKWEDNKFIVTKKVKRHIQDSFYDISILSGIADRIYLGSILLANQKLLENLPTEIPCEKKQITLRVNNLSGLSSSESIAKIDNPTSSSVMGKIEEISKLWLDKYSQDYSHSTILDYKEDIIYSEAQLMAEFGLEVKNLKQKLDLNYNKTEEKQIYLCRLKQIYFSAVMDAPNSPSDLIADSTSWEELESKGVNNQNPPVYVSNIDYGRTIYIKFETSSTSNKVKEAFSSVIKGIDISQNLEYKSIVENSSYNLVVLGGSLHVLNGDGLASVENIKKIVNSGITLSAGNPGYPISYTTTFMKNNEIAVTNTKTDYVETISTIHTSGELKLKHNGAFVARFFINWSEISYDSSGKEILVKCSWEGNGHDRTSSFATTIPLKANVRDIEIKVQGATGLAWEPWRTTLNSFNLPLVKTRTIEISGTTLNQHAKVTPEID